jgi:hypothetical protein
MVFSFVSIWSRDPRGLYGTREKPEQSGAVTRTGHTAKIGGDLQGEPIFRLPGPATALDVPVEKASASLGAIVCWGTH